VNRGEERAGIPGAEVEQAIAEWRAEAGADDVLVFELERAAADLLRKWSKYSNGPRIRNLR